MVAWRRERARLTFAGETLPRYLCTTPMLQIVSLNHRQINNDINTTPLRPRTYASSLHIARVHSTHKTQMRGCYIIVLRCLTDVIRFHTRYHLHAPRLPPLQVSECGHGGESVSRGEDMRPRILGVVYLIPRLTRRQPRMFSGSSDYGHLG